MVVLILVNTGYSKISFIHKGNLGLDWANLRDELTQNFLQGTIKHFQWRVKYVNTAKNDSIDGIVEESIDNFRFLSLKVHLFYNKSSWF